LLVADDSTVAASGLVPTAERTVRLGLVAGLPGWSSHQLLSSALPAGGNQDEQASGVEGRHE
jgi:hypothetical protein